MIEYRTSGFNPYATKYSPFFDSRLAVCAGANFGLVGNGRLYILNLTSNGIVCEKYFETQDCLFDTAWSEQHENQLLTAGGDGSIKLFDIGVGEFPVAGWQEHGREVFSVHWGLVEKSRFLSSSWDGTVKIWNPERKESLMTLPVHSCVYSAQFSPHHPDIVTCVSRDSYLRVYDLRSKASAQNHMTLAIPIHAPPKLPIAGYGQGSVGPTECLTHDWNKYRDSVLATAGVDGVIRTFDLRSPSGPVNLLTGHEYAVRKLSWSPHLSDVLLSASYDMTCRVWTDGSNVEQGGSGAGFGRELGRMDAHTEFAMGVDWCLFGAEGWCATCAWDERVLVWDVREYMRPN
ncbi:peroxisomal targeting signal 2 receptor [Elasticomyces elasticus]|uniref:Peroxin-7 n=1 Tax=Elasticomyces elasticus TaxID=574655 RepID=A0AAN7ZPU1_9PEZI|nr:peroxisomal targeting signal 2 receptor [Elasticomyces elasticus]